MADEQLSEHELRVMLASAMEASGERERLKALLRTKLVECGWRDELKTYISDLIRSRGVDNVTADALIEEVTPYGKAQVPDEVQQHLVQQIRDFFSRVESQQGQ